MCLNEKPVILIRADSLDIRKDGSSNYADTLNKKLFFTKPTKFHDPTITNGNNTGMHDNLDGSILSNPKQIDDNLNLDRYDLDDKKSDILLYNLSYIGVKETDITSEFNPTNLSRKSFSPDFINDVKEANIANHRGLSFIRINDFSKLIAYLNKAYEYHFLARWINYDFKPFTSIPKTEIEMPYEDFLKNNFINLPSKSQMHEFRACLQINFCSSETGKLIDYSGLKDISFTAINSALFT